MAWAFTWTNLNTFYLRLLCGYFGWDWSCGSQEEVENVKFTDDIKHTQTFRQTPKRGLNTRIHFITISTECYWNKKSELHQQCFPFITIESALTILLMSVTLIYNTEIVSGFQKIFWPPGWKKKVDWKRADSFMLDGKHWLILQHTFYS